MIWSAILLFKILLRSGNRDDREKTNIEFEYLVYNFGTCGVWVVEVFFNVLDFKEYFERNGVGEESLLQPATERAEKTRRETVALWIEVVLAVYFFIDSTSVAVHLSREQIHRQAKGMALDVFVNMAAYAFLIYRQFVDWRTSASGHTSNQRSSGAEVV